ncbi:MAG: molybdopterin synthase sulfurylase MoeB [Candidatus Parcubacteria bacterium]|jgi:rhodanese-related sulfurtransferase
MAKREIPHVTCEHLYDLHTAEGEEKPHVVIDLRDRLEFEAGHIKDSLNVPRKELETNIETFLPNKDKRVIVIVGPTQEGDVHEVQDILNEMGYAKVEFLNGGFDRWCEIAPLEIEEGILELTPEEGHDHSSKADHEDEDSRENDEPLY